MKRMIMDTIEKEVTKSLKQYPRISRSATIVLKASIDKVFPLFGPVREKEWARGWQPEIIYSDTNLAEEGMIFSTKGSEEKYVWVMSKYAPDSHTVEYTVHTSQRIWFILVVCESFNGLTKAKITYTYTALTDLAIELNRTSLAKMFALDLQDWEEEINYYLETGRKAPPDNATN
jgi:hypothetical protein